MSGDPRVWLEAELARVETIAQAAGGDAWRRAAHPSETVAIYDSRGGDVVYDEGWPSVGQIEHIVLHHPAAVLRRVAADRRIVEDCENALDGWHEEEMKELARDVIRVLAEGWGWAVG